MSAPKGNQYAMGNNGGRPAHYETPEELAKACQEYFDYCKGEYNEETKEYDRNPENLTVTGLCLFIGFSSRSSLDDYEKRSQEFSYVIKKARMTVENGYEHKLHHNNPTGAIFALKNMGWKDEKDVNHKNNGSSFGIDLSDKSADDLIKLAYDQGTTGADSPTDKA